MSIKENRKLWTDALRSGKYKQGKFALNFNEEYCCMGVLCEVYSHHEEKLELSVMKEYTKYNNCSLMAPEKVAAWVKLNMIEINELINQNDDKDNKTFSEIANFIDSLPIPNEKN